MPINSKTNPVLSLIRENWDNGDTYGSAMAALIDMDSTGKGPATEAEVESGMFSGQHGMMTTLRTEAGWQIDPRTDEDDPTAFNEWLTEPEMTRAEEVLEQHEIVAIRLMDRMVDVLRASGLSY